VKSDIHLRPLIVGEVLFDCFPDHRVLGGAPFNVAWNLRGLGADPLLVTAVGKDEPAEQVRRAMSGWGLDISALQVTPGHATGRVDIVLDAGEPSYRFWEDVAFDHIEPPPAVASGDRFGLIYHGSLAFRSPISRKTIVDLKSRSGLPAFVDINIRRPYFESKSIGELISDAEHVKLNLEELRLLSPDEPWESAADDAEQRWDGRRQRWDGRRRCAQALQKAYRVQNVWITAGEQGAAWVGPAGEFHQTAAPRVEQMVDTVGAGDAFAAMIIRGLLIGTSPAESLQRAARFAARVCGLRGASIADTSFYSQETV
jgi:fructokinase